MDALPVRVSETQRAVLKALVTGGEIIQPRNGWTAWLSVKGPRFGDHVRRSTWAVLLREGYLAPSTGTTWSRRYRLTPAGRDVVS